jgi:hypothetical protein
MNISPNSNHLSKCGVSPCRLAYSSVPSWVDLKVAALQPARTNLRYTLYIALRAHVWTHPLRSLHLIGDVFLSASLHEYECRSRGLQLDRHCADGRDFADTSRTSAVPDSVPDYPSALKRNQ